MQQLGFKPVKLNKNYYWPYEYGIIIGYVSYGKAFMREGDPLRHIFIKFHECATRIFVIHIPENVFSKMKAYLQ